MGSKRKMEEYSNTENKKEETKPEFKVNGPDAYVLRERIAKKLKDIDFDPKHRIKLPLDRLEILLFDYDVKEGIKKLGYFYEGLCKLDLSEVSFDGVSFTADQAVDLSNTNAKINFEEIYSEKNQKLIFVTNINFANVDLSGMNLKDYFHYSFEDCNLSNTKIKVNPWPKQATFIDCDLRGNDFSSIGLACINDTGGLHNEWYIFDGCNLAGTGANISICNFNKDESYDERGAQKALGEQIKKHLLDGCTVCGKYMKTEEEKMEVAEAKREKYKLFFSEYLNETLDMIDAQLDSIGGKEPGNKSKKTLKNVMNNGVKNETK